MNTAAKNPQSMFNLASMFFDELMPIPIDGLTVKQIVARDSPITSLIAHSTCIDRRASDPCDRMENFLLGLLNRSFGKRMLSFSTKKRMILYSDKYEFIQTWKISDPGPAPLLLGDFGGAGASPPPQQRRLINDLSVQRLIISQCPWSSRVDPQYRFGLDCPGDSGVSMLKRWGKICGLWKSEYQKEADYPHYQIRDKDIFDLLIRSQVTLVSWEEFIILARWDNTDGHLCPGKKHEWKYKILSTDEANVLPPGTPYGFCVHCHCKLIRGETPIPLYVPFHKIDKVVGL